MPKIEKGDTVFWYPDAEVIPENGVPAIVTQIEGTTVRLSLIEAGRSAFSKIDGVRHVNDPWYEEMPHHKKIYGGWDYSPLMKRIIELENALTKPKGK